MFRFGLCISVIADGCDQKMEQQAAHGYAPFFFSSQTVIVLSDVVDTSDPFGS